MSTPATSRSRSPRQVVLGTATAIVLAASSLVGGASSAAAAPDVSENAVAPMGWGAAICKVFPRLC